MSIALLLRKAAVGRHGSQEKTGYVLTAHKNEVETELHFLTSCPMYDHIIETHISLRLHRSTKNLKTNPILIYWVKYHSVPSQQQDLWPVATRKGQPVKNTHHCKYNPYLCLFIFPFVLQPFAHHKNTESRHNMTFEISLLFWNFCECNIYC